MLSNHPLPSPSPFAFNLSEYQVFSNESFLHIRWPKNWSFGFSISPFSEYLGLISFRIDLFDLAVQGTLKSLLQHHGSKASIPLVLSLLYGPTLTCAPDYWKNHRFYYTNLFWQSNVCAFEYAIQVCHSVSSKEQASFNFMAAVKGQQWFWNPGK